MSGNPLSPSATLVQALRRVNPAAVHIMAGKLSGEVLAVLGESASTFIPMLEAVVGLSTACSRGEVESATAAIQHMSEAVLTAEAAFIRTCEKQGLAPGEVVDALSAMRELLQFVTECGAAARPA